jgi:hypothetical protein
MLLSSLCSVKRTDSIGVAGGGGHRLQQFDRLGIAEQMKAKTKPNDLARVPEVVAAGEVELAIAGIPTLLSVKGVQVVVLFPAELQSWFVTRQASAPLPSNRMPPRP